MKDPRDPGFGKRLKEIRQRLNLKQKDISKKLGISITTLSDLETGKTYPCYDFFYNIVNAYNINLDYLLFGTGDMLRGKEQDARWRESSFCEARYQYEGNDKFLNDFLEHFFNSRIVHYRVLAYFAGLIGEKKEEIERERTLMESEGT